MTSATHGVAGECQNHPDWRSRNSEETFIAGISGAAVASGVGVYCRFFNGQLRHGSSPRSVSRTRSNRWIRRAKRFLSLQPVTFHYKKDLDSEGIPQFGLVAEEVEKVNPDLVARDEHGKPYTVRYEAVNAMLLNEFLKEHRKVEELEAKLAQQQKDFTARLEEQDAKIQNVNDQVELGKPAPRTVDNNQVGAVH